MTRKKGGKKNRKEEKRKDEKKCQEEDEEEEEEEEYICKLDKVIREKEKMENYLYTHLCFRFV